MVTYPEGGEKNGQGESKAEEGTEEEGKT